MNLFDILNGIEYKILQGSDCQIKNMTIDSRQVVDGSMFFCIRGLHVDGHNFINEVCEHGAKCVVIDRNDLNIFPRALTVIKVENVRKALAFCSANFFKNPSNNMNMIGITGTNGKTSTTYFIEAILRQYNHNVGIIGTIDSKINGEHINIYYAAPTTPDAIELQKILAYMNEKNVDDVVMEVSSHSLVLHKVDSIKFKIGAFTNLSQDHLDFHKNMEDYLHAKSLLFNMCQVGVINSDDAASDYILKNSSCKFVTYGVNSVCDFRAQNIICNEDCVSFDIILNGHTEKFFVPIPGMFTVYNSLCAISSASIMNIPVEIIKTALSKMKNVPGRMQHVQSQNYNVIVDYAHSPDSLENVLKSICQFKKGNLITVFGCGGDRDKSKRSVMGKIASQFSDYCIITSDNPRTESPMQIINEIEKGIVDCKYEKIEDRYDAIKRAIEIANKNDIVLIAGKGHENYQIFADRTIHFDDVETALKILDGR